MNNEKSKSNNLESFSSTSPESNNKPSDFNIKYDQSIKNEKKKEKDEGYNDWNSVPATYDKDESMHEHEKTATNNQWCSTSK